MADPNYTINNNTLSDENNIAIQFRSLTDYLVNNSLMTYSGNLKRNKGLSTNFNNKLVDTTDSTIKYNSVVNALNWLYTTTNSAFTKADSADLFKIEAEANIQELQSDMQTLQSTVESLQTTVAALSANGGSGSGSGSGSTQPVNLDGYVTTEDLNTRLADYATTAALNTVSESIPNSTDFVTTTDLGTTLENYATKAEIPSDPDLSGYATTASLPDFSTFATKAELDGYAKTSDIPSAPDLSGYVTTEALTSALNTYATKEELNGYVTTTALTGYNYVTSDALNAALANYMTATEVNQAIATYAANNSVDGLTLEFVELTAEEKASLVADPPANLLDIINARMPLDTATAEQLEAYSKKIYVVPSFEDGNNDCTEFYLNTKNNPPTWEVFGTAVESLDEIIVAHIEDVPENN